MEAFHSCKFSEKDSISNHEENSSRLQGLPQLSLQVHSTLAVGPVRKWNNGTIGSQDPPTSDKQGVTRAPTICSYAGQVALQGLQPSWAGESEPGEHRGVKHPIQPHFLLLFPQVSCPTNILRF